MGWFTSLRKGVQAAAGSVSALQKIPFVGKAVTALPFVGTAVTAAGLLSDASRTVFGGGGGGGGGQSLPALPMLPGPSQAFSTAAPVQSQGGAVATSGAGGAGSAWLENLTINDIYAMEARGELIGFKNLRVAHRAPKGYIVYHTRSGATFGLRKDIARRSGVLHPHHKPLLTGGQMHAIQKAEKAIKHVQRVGKQLRFIQHAMHPHKGHSGPVLIPARAKLLSTKKIGG